MRHSVSTVLLGVLLFQVGASSGAGAVDDSSVAERMARLEAETQALRAELEELRQHPIRLPEVDPSSGTAMTDATPAGWRRRAPAADADYFTWAELEAQMKKLTFTKGAFRIVPYGYFWADMLYETDRTTPGAYTVYVPSRETEGENAFIIDARRSRFGVDIAGPMIPLLDCAKSSAKLEVDFQSHLTNVNENKATVHLRHVYWQVQNDWFRMLVGQTWDVMSPLYPSTLNYSVGWYGGNIGYRRAQFRLERYFALSDASLLTAQFALAQDIVTDFPADPGIQREPAGWPVLQGRVAYTLGDRNRGRPITLGVSGHIGETGFDFTQAGPGPNPLPPVDDARFRTWSFNVDLNAPITDRLTLKGELFTGENLSPFLGGIGQGVCACTRTPVRSTGGWLDIGYDWTPRLHTHAGYGIDDPVDGDLLFGRTYNHFIFGNISYDVTDKLLTGFEVSSWRTLYQDNSGQNLGPTEPGEAVVFEWMVRYGF